MSEDRDPILNGPKDTELPSSWTVTTLGEVATLQRGNDLPAMRRRSGPYPVVGSNGVVGFHSEFVARGPGVLVGRSGSVGKVTWVDEDYWPLNTALWVKDFHGNDPEFIFYLLSSLDLSFASSGVSVPTLNRNLLHPLHIAIPPVPEQRVIAHVLWTVQQAKEATEKIIAATRQLKQSLMRHLFTYGPVPFDKANNIELQEVYGGYCPKHWNSGQFDNFVLLQRGFDITKDQQRPGSIPVVSSSGVSSFHDTAQVKGPGVVIGRKGSLGTAHYVNSDFWPHDTTLWVKDFKANEPKYVYYFLGTMRLESLDTGTSNPTLNRNYVHALKVAFPPAEEQRQIAAWLTAVDTKLAAEETRRDALDAFFQSLLHHLMTGKVRVRDLELPSMREDAP